MLTRVYSWPSSLYEVSCCQSVVCLSNRMRLGLSLGGSFFTVNVNVRFFFFFFQVSLDQYVVCSDDVMSDVTYVCSIFHPFWGDMTAFDLLPPHTPCNGPACEDSAGWCQATSCLLWRSVWSLLLTCRSEQWGELGESFDLWALHFETKTKESKCCLISPEELL